MKESSIIGVDLAKNVFQLHGAAARVCAIPPLMLFRCLAS